MYLPHQTCVLGYFIMEMCIQLSMMKKRGRKRKCACTHHHPGFLQYMNLWSLPMRVKNCFLDCKLLQSLYCLCKI